MEEGDVADGAEGLVFAIDPGLFAEGAIGVEELGAIEVDGAEVVGEGEGLILHGPTAHEVGVSERRGPHAVFAAGNEIDVGGGAEGEGAVFAGGFDAAVDGVVHADVAGEDDADVADFGSVAGGGVSVVLRGEVEPEEVLAVLDGGAEGDDDAGNGGAVWFFEVAAMGDDVGVIEEVGDHVLFEGLLPGLLAGAGVAAGGVVVDEAEEFAAEGEDGAVIVGVVDAEAAFGDGEVGVKLGHGAGETGIAEGAGGGLGLAAGEVAEGAGGDDAAEDGLAFGGAEEAGFEVVGLGGEVGVAAGEVEEGAVLFEGFVAEGAEGEVLGAVALDDGGGALAEEFAVGEEAVGLG